MSQPLPASHDEIRAVLARVLASERFVRSKRARQLLSYLVEETLAGRRDGLKAFAIAIDVFGKDQSFDAENDTLVRVQAGRLRDLLDGYFSGEGRDSPLVIQLPRGSYVPQFVVLRAPEEVPGAPLPTFARAQTPAFTLPEVAVPPVSAAAPAPGRWRGRGVAAALLGLLLAVAAVFGWRYAQTASMKPMAAKRPDVIRLLVAQESTDPHERAMLHSIRDITARFTAFDTVTHDETGEKNTPAWPEDYRIRIEKVVLGDSYKIFLSAVHVASGTVVGSVRTNISPTSTLVDLLPLEQALVKLLQTHGPIFSDYQRRADYSPVMRCVLLKEDYDVEQTDAGHEKARQCAEALIAAGVEDARNYIALAYMHMEEYTDRRNLRVGDPLVRAIAAAKRALELAPSSAEAHERLMSIYALTGDFEQMIAVGERAMELNPANSSAMDNFAARLNYRGKHQEALKLLLRAEQLQPVAPRWRAYAFFLAYYGQGKMQEASERASTLVGSLNPLYLAARAIVARHKGDPVERNESLILLAREERGFLANPRAMYERRHYYTGLVDRLVSELTGADIVATAR